MKKDLPKFQSVLPADMKVCYEFDQSPYVTRVGNIPLPLMGAVLALWICKVWFLTRIRCVPAVCPKLPDKSLFCEGEFSLQH